MNALEHLSDEQLSIVIIRAIKFNLENAFILYLKNEAVRRISVELPNISRNSSLHESLNLIYLKGELDFLYNEYLRAQNRIIKEQIADDINLLETAISLSIQTVE